MPLTGHEMAKSRAYVPWLLNIAIAVPATAVILFLASALYQGDVGFKVDKTQRGLFVSRILSSINPVQKGDRIVAIQAVPYQRVLGYLLFPCARENKLTVTVERNGTRFTTVVHTIPLSLLQAARLAWPQLILIVSLLTLAVTVRFRTPNTVQARLFFLMLCGLATSTAATLASCVAILNPLVISLSFLLLTTSNWFSFSTLLHFALRFPADYDLLQDHWWPVFLIYLLPPAITLAISLQVGGISPDFWGWLQRTRNIFLPVILAIAFAKEWRDYQITDTHGRKRFKLLLLTYWISFGPYLFLYLLPVIFFDQPLVSFRIVTVCFLVLPFAYLYGLVRYRLFDADRLLSRFISYAMLAGIVLLFYSLFLVVVKRWLFGNRMLSEELFLIFFVGSVLAFHPIQKRMERIVRRLFFRYRPVPAELMHRFSDKITGLLSLSDIVRAMVEELPRKINVDLAAIMLLGEKHSRLFPENLRFGSSPWPGSKLVAMLRQGRLPYVQTDRGISNREPERELREIREAGFSLVLPMRTATGMSGLLFIGFRKDGRRFSSEDIHLMAALANQGAIALENAKRHESLLESKQQLEQLFNERVQQEKMALVGEMTSMVAHELKNPLGIIHSSAQYLADSVRPPEVQKEMLRYIVDEVRHLNASIESLLGMARQPPPRFSRVDLAVELPELVRLWIRSSDHNPRIHVWCQFDQYLEPFYADLHQLRQVLFNLIRNSEEMMPDGGEVILAAESNEDRMVIMVMDNGPGIRQEDRENLFKSFFTTKKGGLGLGLVVCRQIIKAHNGSIELIGRPEGGTTARIELPLKPLATTGLQEETRRHG